MRRALTLLLAAAHPLLTAAVPLGTWEYRLAWNGLPAAHATVAIRGSDDDAEPYRVEAETRTNWLIDLLWSLRARVASAFTRSDLAPLGFRYERRIRGETMLTEVVFGEPAGGMTGTFQRRGEERVVSVDGDHVLDPVTAIFRALNEPLALGRQLRYEVFTGESRYRVDLSVAAEETVAVDGRSYDAWRLEPQVWKIGQGLEPRLRNTTIWVSKGPVQAVVRVRGEVYVGAITCDLVAPRRD